MILQVLNVNIHDQLPFSYEHKVMRSKVHFYYREVGYIFYGTTESFLGAFKWA